MSSMKTNSSNGPFEATNGNTVSNVGAVQDVNVELDMYHIASVEDIEDLK